VTALMGLAGLAGGGVVGGAVARMLLDTSHFDKGLATSEGKLQGFARRSSTIGGALTRGLSVPLALIAAGATTLAIRFDEAFTRIDAVSNASAQSIAKWRREVLQLAGRTAQSPQELAEALYFLASAGLKAGTEMAALEAAAKGSAVGLGNTADLARITANALNAYAESGLTATQVMDSLTAAIKAGTAEPDEFADALGRLLPIASRAGITFDEVTASLAALSNIGLDVDEGVTAMRGLLQALVAPGSMAAETLREVGITADQMRRVLAEDGLLAALQLLEERTGGNIDLLRKIVPNIRALTGELGLTGENARRVAQIFDEVREAQGALGEAFETTAASPMFKFRQALAKIEGAAISLGTKIIPIAEQIIGKLTATAEAFTRLSPGVQEAVVKFGLLAIALGPVVKLIGVLGTSLPVVVAALGAVSVVGAATDRTFSRMSHTTANLTTTQDHWLKLIAAGKQTVPEYQKALERWNDTARRTGGIQVDVNKAVEKATALTRLYTLAENADRDAARARGVAARQATFATEDAARAAGFASAETRELAQAHRDVAAAAAQQRLAELSLAGGLLGIQGASLSAKDAQLSYQQARKDLIELEKDGKRGTLEYKQAVNALRQAELSTITAQIGLANSIAEYIIELDGADVSQRSVAKTVREFGRAAGLSKEDINRLIDDVRRLIDAENDVPENVKTKFDAETGAATQKVISYKALLATVAHSITTTALFRAPTGGGFGQVAAGAVLRAQAGMVVRRPTMIRPDVMAGEGRYHTEFGQGAEGVLPLTEDVFDRMGRAIARHMGDGRERIVVVPVMMSDEFERRTRRTIRNDLIPRSGR
jgi:TP901 family phage tail tape measure protein